MVATNNSSNIPSVSATAVVGTGTGFSTLGYSVTPAASILPEWDVNKNLSSNNFIKAYTTTVTAAATTTLVVGSTQLQYFTGTTTQTVVLPVTSTLVLGQSFTIVNNSTGIVTVQSSGANTIKAMSAGTQLVVTVINTGVTTAAGWNAEYTSSSALSVITDSGTASGTPLTLTAFNAANQTGSSVKFTGSGSTIVFNVTDASNNTLMGFLSGNQTTLSGSGNTGFGKGTLHVLSTANDNTGVGYLSLGAVTTSGRNTAVGAYSLVNANDVQNTAVGWNALGSLNSGTDNIAIGYTAMLNPSVGSFNIGIGSGTGNNYSTVENSNILLNSQGVASDLNTLRIGQATGSSNQYLNKAFIHGINGVTLAPTPLMVTIDSTTSQLGVQAIPAGGSLTVAGDTGSITANPVTIYANNAANINGATVKFVNSGSTSTFNVGDGANNNTFIGNSAGTLTYSGLANTGIGSISFASITSGADNVGLGYATGVSLLTGSFNTYLGFEGGLNHTGAESSNICINSLGVVGESHSLRIGAGSGTGAQQLNKVFISGIYSTTPAGYELVVVSTTTDQLGSIAVPITITWQTVSGTTQTIAVNKGYITNSATQTTYTLPSTASIGDMIRITSGSTAAATAPWKIAQNAGQQINVGASSSTVGVTGSVTSTLKFDSIELLCVVSGTSTIWVAQFLVGAMTVV